MMLQGVAQLGKEPRVPEPEVVQVSLASIQALPDLGEDLSRIVAMDEIREFLGKGIELFHERRPPLIPVHGPKVTSESTATASRFASSSLSRSFSTSNDANDAARSPNRPMPRIITPAPIARPGPVTGNLSP
jgi:hypothetical protein